MNGKAPITRGIGDNGGPELADDLIWGGAAIAKAVGLNTRQGFYALENGHIPAKKVGNLWVASRTKLRAHLTD